MNTSKAALSYSILGKLLSIIGYITSMYFLYALIFISLNTAWIILSLILIPVGLFIVLMGRVAKKEIKRFKKYLELIKVQNITSIEEIAVATNQTNDFVRTDIENMIKRRFFTKEYIDTVMQNVQQKKVQESGNNKCNGCGANITYQNGIAKDCEYCGVSKN